MTYHTFGGTSPQVYRLYLRLFDAESAKPQYKDGKRYFVWRAVPNEITGVSPILDKIRDFAPEVTANKGRGLIGGPPGELHPPQP